MHICVYIYIYFVYIYMYIYVYIYIYIYRERERERERDLGSGVEERVVGAQVRRDASLLLAGRECVRETARESESEKARECV